MTPRGDADARVRGHLRRHALLPRGGTVICAVSGGADSMALLAWVQANRDALGVRVEAAHLHHEIPEARSDAAAEAVRALCQQWSVVLHERRVDVPALARQRGLGIEAAGRRARQCWFRALARERGARVATAHTADDQAETVLMRMLRGAGTRGLRGILPCLGRPPWLVRPFLVLKRTETRHMATAWQLPVVEDPTNDDTSYGVRNKVRLDLLPLLARDFNPRVVAALCRLADAARDDEAMLARLARRAARGVLEGPTPVVVAATAGDLPAAVRTRVEAAAVRRAGGDTPRLDAAARGRLHSLLVGRVGRRTRVAGLVALRTQRGVVLARRDGPPARALGAGVALPVPGEVRVGGWHVRAWVARDGGESSPRRAPSPDGYRATMRAPWRAALSAPEGALQVRSRRPGDRWRPPRGSGSCKLKATLNAWPVPASERDAVPVVTVGDQVACIAGWGVDERRRVFSGHVAVVQLEFTFTDEEST